MLNQILRKSGFLAGFLFLPYFLFAESLDGMQRSPTWYLGASIGSGFDSAKATNQFVLDDATPPSIGYYTMNTSGNSSQDYGLFGGMILPPLAEQAWASRLNMLLGFGVYSVSKTSFSGQGNISDGNDFHFNYDVAGQRIVAETRITYLIQPYFQPEIYLAAGYGWLSTSNFSNIPDDPSTTNLPIYAGTRHDGIVGGAGFGVLSQLTMHWHLSAEYQVNNLGLALLGAAPYTVESSAFNAGRVIERTAKLSVYYYF